MYRLGSPSLEVEVTNGKSENKCKQHHEHQFSGCDTTPKLVMKAISRPQVAGHTYCWRFRADMDERIMIISQLGHDKPIHCPLHKVTPRIPSPPNWHFLHPIGNLSTLQPIQKTSKIWKEDRKSADSWVQKKVTSISRVQRWCNPRTAFNFELNYRKTIQSYLCLLYFHLSYNFE